MKYPIRVFLDTNVFDSQRYDFTDKGLLAKLKQLAFDGKIGLLISDVVVGEAKRHIKRNIADARNALLKAMKKKLDEQGYESKWTSKEAFAILKTSPKYSPIFTLFERSCREEMIAEAITQFDTYLADTNAMIVESKDIDVSAILNDFFEVNPPFGNKKDKKSEFPDAIIMAEIRAYSRDYSDVCLISNDGAFESLKAEGIEVIKELTDFFAYIDQLEKWNEPVQKYIAEEHSIIIDLIHSKIVDINPFVDGEDCDRKGICSGFTYDETEITKITDIDFKFLTVTLLKGNNLSVVLSCKAKIYADCSYFDEAESIWDSEDKAYIYSKYGYTKEIHIVEFEGMLSFEIDDEEIEIIDHGDIQFEITLDQYSRISQKVVSDNAITEYLNNKTFDCPNCHSTVEVEELAEEMECVFSGERSMGEENQYSFIDGEYATECPECHRQFKISGDVCEYPVGVVNFDGLKVESVE